MSARVCYHFGSWHERRLEISANMLVRGAPTTDTCSNSQQAMSLRLSLGDPVSQPWRAIWNTKSNMSRVELLAMRATQCEDDSHMVRAYLACSESSARVFCPADETRQLRGVSGDHTSPHSIKRRMQLPSRRPSQQTRLRQARPDLFFRRYHGTVACTVYG